MTQSATSLFISATDTNVGKTYTSIALLHELLSCGFKASELAYYKPIQCGLENSDIDLVATALPEISIYNSYLLKYPAAPSFAAEQENLTIDIQRIISDYQVIKTKYKLVIVEGAGGLAVPINGDYLVSDLLQDLAIPLLLVIRPNLGTINHSLLSLEHARNKGLNILGFYTNFYKESSNGLLRPRAPRNDSKNDPDGSFLRFQPRVHNSSDNEGVYLPHELSAPSIISELSNVTAFASISEIIEQCLITPTISN